MKRLIKSYDRVIAGVCGGIAAYINPELDPLIVRLGWFIFSLFNPLMILLYFILALVMPSPKIIGTK